MNELTLQPQYEYAEVEYREITIKERMALIEEACFWKLKIKRIEEDNEPKLRAQCPTEECIRQKPQCKPATLAVKFGGKLTEQQMETYRANFEERGWKKITDDDERLSWVNPENTWCSTVNKKTGQWIEIDSEWVRNLNMRKPNEQ